MGGAHAYRACEPVQPGTVGIVGDWNLPVATTTRSNRSVVAVWPTSHPEPSRLTRSTRLPNRTRDTKVERLGVAMEVGEDVAGRRVEQVGLVLEVTEGRQDATGVGVHRRPHTTDARQPGPLTAQHRSLFENRRLEPCDRSQRAVASPPGPAPSTATLPVIGELSHDGDETAGCLSTRRDAMQEWVRSIRRTLHARGGARWPG